MAKLLEAKASIWGIHGVNTVGIRVQKREVLSTVTQLASLVWLPPQ